MSVGLQASPATDRDVDPEQILGTARRLGRELASAEGATDDLLRALAASGPVAAGFARYLGTRADVVPAGLRADLVRVDCWLAPAPPDDVRAVLEQAWGRPLAGVCTDFEPEPVELHFPTQTHRVWLKEADSALVRCVPAAFEAMVEPGIEALPTLRDALAPALLAAHAFEDLVRDYSALLRRLLDQTDDLAAAGALVADARAFPLLRAARPYPALSTSRVSVQDEVAAVPLGTPGFDRAEAGAALCRTWLRQALLGRPFPVEAEPTDFLSVGRRQVCLRGRLYAQLDAEARLDIQGYLVGVAAADQDLSLRFLLRQLVPQPGADHAGLQRRIRHGWSTDADAAGGSELLAQLLLHWQLAEQHGYRPTAGLVSFYRGAFAAVRAATAFGADDDPLRDALAALQLRVVTSQVEALTGVSPSSARSAREAAWRLLTTAAAGSFASDRGPAGAGAPLPAFGALLLALLAVSLAMPALTAAGATWADATGAAAVAGLGICALYLIARRPPTP